MSHREEMRDRSQRILEQMFRDGTLSVQGVAAQLGVSVATVRRDMRRLASEGPPQADPRGRRARATVHVRGLPARFFVS